MAVPLLLRTDETVRLVLAQDPDVKHVPGDADSGQWFEADKCRFDPGATVATVRGLNGSEKGRLVLTGDAHGFIYTNLRLGLVAVEPMPEGLSLDSWVDALEIQNAAGLSNWIINLTAGTDSAEEAQAGTFRGAGEGHGEPGHDGDGDPV